MLQGTTKVQHKTITLDLTHGTHARTQAYARMHTHTHTSQPQTGAITINNTASCRYVSIGCKCGLCLWRLQSHP